MLFLPVAQAWSIRWCILRHLGGITDKCGIPDYKWDQLPDGFPLMLRRETERSLRYWERFPQAYTGRWFVLADHLRCQVFKVTVWFSRNGTKGNMFLSITYFTAFAAPPSPRISAFLWCFFSVEQQVFSNPKASVLYRWLSRFSVKRCWRRLFLRLFT